MQHRIRRTIAGVLDVVRRASRELVRGVEAGDLQLALETEGGDGGVCLRQELVVVEEVAQHLRMDQEAGLTNERVSAGQVPQLLRQFFGEPFGGLLLAHAIAHQPAPIRACCERAQAQPDHGLLQPVARGGYDMVGRLAARLRVDAAELLRH
jgi:hypothetical protein